MHLLRVNRPVPSFFSAVNNAQVILAPATIHKICHSQRPVPRFRFASPPTDIMSRRLKECPKVWKHSFTFDHRTNPDKVASLETILYLFGIPYLCSQSTLLRLVRLIRSNLPRYDQTQRTKGRATGNLCRHQPEIDASISLRGSLLCGR